VHPRVKLTETKDGTIFEVFIKPHSPKFSITIENDEVLVHATEEPAKGKVNRELVKQLSKVFHSPIELVSGFTSKQKRLLAKGVAKTDVEFILRNQNL
jgi:uncharacterized protein (TIGR00251 family)